MKLFICILAFAVGAVPEMAAQSPGFYEISRLPFTSDHSDEFAPAWFLDGLVFTTNRRTGNLISRLTQEGEALYNIFYTSQQNSGKWITPGILARNLRSNYHDGPASFSADGSRMYFTKNIPANGKELSRLGIFIADYSDGEWINIRPFQHNSNNYNVSHPGIGPDGKTLYFASDMPGGYGGMDIYSSALKDNVWQEPVNLGNKINSAKDEVFPYIHQGGRLYFSSNNNKNDVFDLFFSKYIDDNWQNPVKLPEPFNSGADDFGFIADREVNTGYFSSNREGTDNIYAFTSTFPEFTMCETIREPGLCFDFYEASGGEIDTTSFYFEWDMGDGSRLTGKEVEYCFSGVGTYRVSLNVIDKLTGEISSNVVSHNLPVLNPEQPYITSPDTCYVNELIAINAFETNLPGFEIGGYYWDLGDGTKNRGVEFNHRFINPGIYEIRLGVLSDPDSPYGQQQKCVYKNIVVLGNTD